MSNPYSVPIKEQDIISVKRSLGLDVKNYTQEDLQTFLGQSSMITKGYRDSILKNNPSSAKDLTIHGIANDSAGETGMLQKSLVTGVDKERNSLKDADPDFKPNEIAKRMAQSSGKKTKERVNTDNLEEVPAEFKEETRTDDRERIPLPGPSNNTEALVKNRFNIPSDQRKNWDDEIDKQFGGSSNDLAKWIKECIPCGLRKPGPDHFRIDGLVAPWSGMGDRLQGVLDGLKDLSAESEGLDDLCRLLGLLDFSCVPDLFSLISLIFVASNNGENVVAGWAVAPLSVMFVLFIFLIEILVAFLQAYIFTLLSAVFIGLAVKEEDH